MLDWINTDEFLPLLVLIGLLVFIGQQFTSMNSREALFAKRIAGTTFLLYAAAGIYSWGVSVTEAITIILRASLASGVVYGLALVLLTPVSITLKYLKPKPVPKAVSRIPRPMPPPMRTPEEIAREAQKEERQRKERVDKVNKSQNRVAAFFNQHPEIHDDYPRELFETRLEARFGSVSDKEALAAAEELIEGMKPFVAKAREQQRAEQEEARQAEAKAKEEERKKNEPEEKRQAVRKLTEWYQQEKEAIEQRLPEGRDRDDVLRELFTRYDRLMKEALNEVTL